MILSLAHAKEKVIEIHDKIDQKSLFYGKLLNWHENLVWHYGIGINDDLIFDTASFHLFSIETQDIHIVPDVQKFTQNITIERLCYAIICFHDWNYGLLGWNCEHLARLIATDCAISYEVKKAPFPIPLLNHNGYHPEAKNILEDCIRKNPYLLTDILCDFPELEDKN